MKRIFVPTCGIAAWRERLADPEKHWKREASAFETAVSWEVASGTTRGIPASIAKVLDQARALQGSELIVALPEHKVPLPGGSRSSQTDVWALLRGPAGLVSMAVEGKADESFGDTIEGWRKDESKGKQKRLEYLMTTLKRTTEFPTSIRYQLLHRTASAILEARRVGAPIAVMMVQSFRETPESQADYVAFGECLGAALSADRVVQVVLHTEPQLYLGWATTLLCTDREIALAAV